MITRPWLVEHSWSYFISECASHVSLVDFSSVASQIQIPGSENHIPSKRQRIASDTGSHHTPICESLAPHPSVVSSVPSGSNIAKFTSPVNMEGDSEGCDDEAEEQVRVLERNCNYRFLLT